MSDILTIVSKLGGFIIAFKPVIGVIVYDVSQYLFFMVMIKRMYFAATQDGSIFSSLHPKGSYFVKNQNCRFLEEKELPPVLKQTSFNKRIKKHKYINVKLIDKILLYFCQLHPFVPMCCCQSKNGRKSRLIRMFEKGKRRLYNNLNILKMMKRINELTLIVYQYNLKNVNNHWALKHDDCNVINCD